MLELLLRKNFIKENFIPVVSPMGIDDKKQTYNINADIAAGALARNLKSRRLMLMYMNFPEKLLELLEWEE